jgi:hypothetical protein
LIALILLNEAHTIIVYASFKMHQDYIVNNLCVMREAEENTCLGSCQLKRKLDFGNTEDNSEKNKAVVEVVKRFNFYRCAVDKVELTGQVLALPLHHRRVLNSDWREDDFVNSIFHPPKAS